MINILLFILIVILIILICYTSIRINEFKNIKYDKQKEFDALNKEFKTLKTNLSDSRKEYDSHLVEKAQILAEKTILYQELEKQRESLDNNYDEAKQKMEKELESFKSNTSHASEQYFHYLEKNYVSAEEKYQKDILSLETEKEEILQKIENIRNSLSAGVQAQLREQKKKNEINFYKIKISQSDINDIKRIEEIKPLLSQPVAISKLIWSQFFQKETTSLCNRVLGTETKIGIYKITNIETEQCYIGQSVNLATRWKDHVKCGLGIDASATNKLYSAMQEYGVYNFSFELLEECKREDLNQKEKFWINMYQSDVYGYNSTRGNK